MWCGKPHWVTDVFTQDQNCALHSIVPRIMSHFREETISVLNSQYFLHVLINVVFALISTSSCVGQWKSEMNSGGFSHFYRLFLLIVSTCVAPDRQTYSCKLKGFKIQGIRLHAHLLVVFYEICSLSDFLFSCSQTKNPFDLEGL